jgi:hypothetical protein
VKKVLIGVGVGCGVLVLALGIAVVAGGFWFKNKVQEVAQGSEKTQAVEKRVAAANQRHAFTPPAKGLPIQLTESRLQDYLKVRSAMEPVFNDFEAKAKTLDKKEDGLSKGLQAFGLLADLRADLTTKWLEELEHQSMSPHEFNAITAAVYTAGFAKVRADMPKQMRQMHEQLRQQLQKQADDENLPPEARTAARQQLEETEKRIAELPQDEAVPPELQKISADNLLLVEKYREQISHAKTTGLEVFLIGTDGDIAHAFQKALGEGAGVQADEQEQ